MFNNKKIVVYTAIMGNFDKIEDPKVVTDGIDYICFTDNPKAKSNVWKIVVVNDEFNNSRKKARHIKINPHLFLKDYELSIWIDGNVNIKKDLSCLINELVGERKTKIATFRHFSRDCIYDEALECAVTKKDNIDKIYKQISECIDNGYPTKNGLAETNVMFRMHNDIEIINVMSDWWRCVNNNSIRDQLSFNYILYKSKVSCEYFEGNTRTVSEYFNCNVHKNEKTSYILRAIFSFFKNFFK